MYKEAGFTLIEVVVTLIIAGILASIAGMGIVQGAKGYVFASENAAMTQKAELAMARMSLELRDISDVKEFADTPATITYIRNSSDHTIAFGNDQVTIDSKVLVDKVVNFKLTYYYKSDGDSQLTETDDPVNNMIARIDIELILQHTDGEITFKTKINPRNNF